MVIRNSSGSQLFREAQGILSRRMDVTQERVIAELAALAFSNIGDVISWGPDGLSVKSADERRRSYLP
jgi:hypothetical protein